MEIDSICDVDNDLEDPQLCAMLASDIYMHLRDAEVTLSCLQPFLFQAFNICFIILFR
jgi:hypothetical protein